MPIRLKTRLKVLNDKTKILGVIFIELFVSSKEIRKVNTK